MWLRRDPVLLHVNNKYRQTDNLYQSTMVKKAVQLVGSCVSKHYSIKNIEKDRILIASGKRKQTYNRQ